MPPNLTCWARPRPLRVAFLIEDGEHAALTLDGIFADCYNRWGGRFSLIIPCENGRITENYWPWLEAYDPDTIYSYVPLCRADILEIHERIYPANYYFHNQGREPQLDLYGFKPSYHFSPLSSLSTIFKLARHNTAAAAGIPINIIDCWPTEIPSRFLLDNFGTYNASLESSKFPPDAMTVAKLLTIVSHQNQSNRGYGVPSDLNAVPNEMMAVKEFAENRATSLSLVSALFAPKLDIPAHRWSGAFNLVVGDSFADRIMFWNARLFIPAWLNSDLCCLRVDFDQLENSEFLAVLGQLLKQRNHVRSTRDDQTQIVVRSLSANANQLSYARDAILSTKPWSAITTEQINGLDDILPSIDALQSARVGNRFDHRFFSRPDWTPFTWSPPTARPPAIPPDHLSDAPPQQVFTEGFWCTDHIFQNEGPKLGLAQENIWALPRRWRMTDAFKVSIVATGWHRSPHFQRRSRDGNLVILINMDNAVETIEVPTAYEALHHALTVDGTWANLDGEHDWVHPPNKVSWMCPSNEARYLTGILGMAGGLQSAIRFLLNPFLRDAFARLGGTPNLAHDNSEPTINRLRKKVRYGASFDLQDEAENQALAELITKAARELKRPMSFISHEDLKKRWRVYCAETKNRGQLQAEPEFDWEEHEGEELESCLIELRRRQMMFQGYQWTCQK